MPGSAKPEDPLTGKDADNALTAFGKAVEVPYKNSGEIKETTLTRGELAELLKAYVEPLMQE